MQVYASAPLPAGAALGVAGLGLDTGLTLDTGFGFDAHPLHLDALDGTGDDTAIAAVDADEAAAAVVAGDAVALAAADDVLIAAVEQTANTNDEVVAAAAALISAKVDAVFTPTDNVIMAAELAIADDLAKAGIPHYTGADSFVRNGAFATCGVNYTELGARTATLAYQAMTQGMDGMEDYYRMDGGIITVNTDTAAVLKADYSVFAQMAQLVEVTTTKD